MKAILAIDMPEGCVNCALCRMENRKGYNDYICVPQNQLAPMAIGTDKPDWCPLRPMPKKKPEPQSKRLATDVWDRFYTIGWNKAIEAIEGSGEDAKSC